MRFVDTIEKKADGGELSKEEIHEMIESYVKETFLTIRCLRCAWLFCRRA